MKAEEEVEIEVELDDWEMIKCPHCGSTNVKFLYGDAYNAGRLLPDGRTEVAELQVDTYHCDDCKKIFRDSYVIEEKKEAGV